ncbi:TMEM232 [Bugula neritina]|uniref:TMEM232 n=1 Tax=Bugula neritina TaxID=10212 RepID=A0A7J7KFR0_BUGNE|nr:TMEM232 [Bugula neritina]
MPLERVPIVHRFGIISHNQRVNLQERLFEKAVEQATARPYDKVRNPNEIQESFVHRFNGATTVADKEKYEEQARKHIERLKRKCGLGGKSRVSDKELDEAWVDLTILSQCKGKIQEDSLDVLIASLDQASFDSGHIQGLFFLAETALYWLRTDAINSPYLRISEIKLLKMGYMVFLRLFYHHMVGDLRGHKLFKSRLYMYLDGLNEYQEAYSPYPNAHLCLRYIIEVGKVMFLDDDLDPGEVKETENVQMRSHFTKSATSQPRSNVSAVSRSVHDLAPSLWHALDVWRCVTITGKQVEESLYSLARCGLGMSLENWIDGAAALVVLAEAAKANLPTLHVLQNLACGLIPTDIVTEEGGATDHSLLASHHHNVKQDVTQGQAETQRHLNTEFLSKVSVEEAAEEDEDLKELQQTLKEAEMEYLSPKTPRKITRQSQRTSASRPGSRDSKSGKRVNIGTKYGEREVVSPTTFRNSPVADTPGIQGWQWEVAVTYTELLVQLVMFGRLSTIQKRALLGSRNVVEEVRYVDCTPPLTSAGLLDMLHFHVIGDASGTLPPAQDWSWRVRYSAVQGLVQICSHLKGDKMADGLYNLAWRSLQEASAHEFDERVLEALKVGQVTIKSSDKKKSPTSSLFAGNAGNRLADGLAKRYLPPLAVTTSVPKLSPRKTLPKQPVVKPNVIRTTLREEKVLAKLTDEPPIPDFKSRTSRDLMRIWRKDLQEQLRLEEEQKLEELTSQSSQNSMKTE